jgi:hypothetical protein
VSGVKEGSNKNSREKTGLKIEIAVACVVTIALVILLATRAWFYFSRDMQTATKIHTPYKLLIAAGHKEDVINFDLGTIDAEKSTSENYVFAVYGKALEGYTLQLAHTTNIPFTYTIYSAEEKKDKPDEYQAAYTSSDNAMTYYYVSTGVLDGKYINRSTESNIADGTKHALTYSDYDNVQKNAEPLYWQGNLAAPTLDTDGRYIYANNATENDEEGNFIHYYILNVTWTKGTVKNDKETDIVYLTAG